MKTRLTRLTRLTLFALLSCGVLSMGGAAWAQQPLEPLPPAPPSSNPTPAPSPSPSPAPLPPTKEPPPTASDFGVPENQASPTTDRPPQTLTNEEQAKVFRPSFKGAGGYQYTQVHGVPINAGRIRLGVGGQTDTQAHYAVLSILIGETSNGLHATDVRIGWNADLYRTSILRLGIDIEGGYLVIHRATQDAHLWALGVGGGVHASVDAFAFGPRDDHAIYFEGKFEAHAHFGPAFVWGPSVLAGVRY